MHVDLARLDLNMDRHLNMEERRVHLHMEERHVVPTGTGVYFKRTIFKGHFPVDLDLHVNLLFLSALIKPRDQKACSDPVPPPKGGILALIPRASTQGRAGYGLWMPRSVSAILYYMYISYIHVD